MTSYQHIDHGFDPVYDKESRILILGSFPSVASRANDFYYGNPRNRFWQIIAACLGKSTPPNAGEPLNPTASAAPASLDQSILAKKQLLLDGRIALWDVIASCDIKGSSDASIKNVVPADVPRILNVAPIEAVICNGATAGRLYKRYLQWQVGLEATVLPSTSPANAAWSTDRLIERWREELQPLLATALTATNAATGDEKAKDKAAGRKAKRSATGKPTPSDERTDYEVVRIPTPPASNWAVHKSMQGNKRKDTKPELLVRERLQAAGLTGYRLQWKVPGHPDIAWPGKRVAIEIRGCFWHRCPHCNPSMPKKNIPYWQAKFARNVERDAENLAALEAAGWRVHIVWECELKKKTIDATMAELLPKLAAELGKQLTPPDETAGSETSDDNGGGEAHDAEAGNAGKAADAGESPSVVREESPTRSADPAAKSYYVYVIECADGTLYTGYTPDIEARFAAHQAGRGAKYTRGRGPLNLLASAAFDTKHDAMSVEAKFKRLPRNKKDGLLAKASKPNETFEQVLREEFNLHDA